VLLEGEVAGNGVGGVAGGVSSSTFFSDCPLFSSFSTSTSSESISTFSSLSFFPTTLAFSFSAWRSLRCRAYEEKYKYFA